MSPGLLRAREIFRWPNMITGLSLGSFAVAVWAYSLSAVSQENFEDIDAEARKLASRRSTTSTPVLDREMQASTQPSGPFISAAHQQPAAFEPARRNEPKSKGLLPGLIGPYWLEPEAKTVIWGAPPVDCIGSWKEQSHVWERFLK
jgi:cytochrome c oxidase assembly factor 3, fungi type